MDREYVTLVLPFNACNDVASSLLRVARLFRLAVLRLFDKCKSERSLGRFSLIRKYRSLAYEILRNRRYADGALDLVRSVLLSARELDVNPNEIEFRDWLLFQAQGDRGIGNACITLRPDLSFAITVAPRRKVVVRPHISKRYAEILKRIHELGIPYYARVVLRGFGRRDRTLWLHGEIHVSVEVGEYYKLVGIRENRGKNYAGVDTNVDRLNLAIVDRYGNLLDHKTFWFKYARERPSVRERVWSDIGEKIHAMLDYAYHHGVKVMFTEDPEMLGQLSFIWRVRGERKSKTWNFLVNSFRVSVIRRIMLKAPLYGIVVKTVNPAGTSSSEEHKKLMKKLGLDRHTVSALLIARRGLGLF